MQFHPLLKMDIDPASIFIDRGKLKDNKVTQIQYKGDSSEKVDLVFIAEGYTADDQGKNSLPMLKIHGIVVPDTSVHNTTGRFLMYGPST